MSTSTGTSAGPDSGANIIDVDQDRFDSEVVARSHEQPVVVDFWADWCAPCRTLGPLLEQAVEERDGAVRLAKVDVDANQALAQRYGIRGIPAVKGFRDGEVVAEFVGAVAGGQIQAFLDELVPSAADEAAARAARLEDGDPDGAAAAYREALELDPGHDEAAIGLARLTLEDDPEAALELLRPHRPAPRAETIAARAELRLSGAGDEAELRERVAAGGDPEARLLLGRLLAADGEHEEAIEHLLEVVRSGGEHAEPAREHLVQLFTALGDEHPLVQRTRPELAKALF